MSTAQYGPVTGKGRDDEDGLVDEWGVRYEGHHKPGGGRFSTKKKRSRRKYLLVAAGVTVLVVLIVIIVVAVQKHTRLSPRMPPTFEQIPKKPQGLVFYPQPKTNTVLITYTVDAHFNDGGYEPLTHSLDKAVNDYRSIEQISDDFVVCNATYAPPDRICKYDISVLRDCTQHNEYGYSSGTPCILLKLTSIDMIAKPFGNGTEVSKKLGDRYSPNYIGVTCDGETEEDRSHISRKKDTMFKSAIQYFPPEGFPAYWFRQITIHKFLPPIVMVKFNTLNDFEYIRIKCTAWGQNFNNGNPQKSTLFSTSFVIYQK